MSKYPLYHNKTATSWKLCNNLYFLMETPFDAWHDMGFRGTIPGFCARFHTYMHDLTLLDGMEHDYGTSGTIAIMATRFKWHINTIVHGHIFSVIYLTHFCSDCTRFLLYWSKTKTNETWNMKNETALRHSKVVSRWTIIMIMAHLLLYCLTEQWMQISGYSYISLLC